MMLGAIFFQTSYFILDFIVVYLGRWGCVRSSLLHTGFLQFSKWELLFIVVHGLLIVVAFLVVPGGSEGKASACNVGDPGFIPGLGRSPGEGNGNPLQYSCLENPIGWRSLVGYSPWGRKESDTTERCYFLLLWSTRLQVCDLQWLQHMGSVVATQVQTRVPCIGRQILIHCTAREVPLSCFIFLSYIWVLSSVAQPLGVCK